MILPVASLAAVEVHVVVDGLSESLHDNVLSRLSIYLQKGNDRLNPNAVRRLHKLADDDIKSALAPLGYYNPVIKSSLENRDEAYHAEYTIDKGPPTIVKEITVEMVGPGRDNSRLSEALSRFEIREGDILNQGLYESGKKKLVHTAFGEGFLDASFTERALRINREINSATIRLILDSGQQYLFGETSSDQQILKQSLLQRYLPYKSGEPYNPAKLFELQSVLYRTDFFSRVVVRGQIDKTDNLAVPVDIELVAPEKLNKYSLGFGYATDTGLRGKVDWSNRLLNSRGHQISGSFQLAEFENTLSLRFNSPRKDPRFNTLVHSIGYQDKTWDDTTTRLMTGAVTQEYSGPRFKFSAGLELRDEVYDVGDTSGDSTLLIPSLNSGVVFADDILFTQNGLQTSVGFLGSVEGLVSDVNFLQATGNGKLIISPFTDWRLIGRGSLGVTLVDTIDALPPSLRFYTGGDSTIRGYGYKSIGTKDTAGAVIGGRYLVVGSIEMERVVTENWSLAGFWDGGTATDDLSLDFHQGAGGGIRFRLPFGQVRLDLASAITEKGNPYRVHLAVGGDL